MPTDARLEGKVALVTGAGFGIGRGIALRLADEGADVMIVDISPAMAEESASMVRGRGRQAAVSRVDVSRRDDVQRMLRETLEALGRIDVLVNNAGVIPVTGLFDVTDEEWDRCLAVNLTGPFLCTQIVGRHMVEAHIPGKIINIASVESSVARRNQISYGASKGGVLMLTRATALELAEHGITVNAVGPGAIDSGHGYYADAARAQSVITRTPLKRIGTPDDVAGAVAFLASADADYITGSIIYVGGGILIE
jgi:glucose 1-dehydrogenase